MSMNYKKLLPSNLRGTRWGAWADVIGSVMDQLKTEVFNKLKYKYDPENSDRENLEDLITRRGFPLLVHDGFASSDTYLQRRNEALTTERLYRTGRESYRHILKSFYLLGYAYSLRKNSFNQLVIVRTPIEDLSSRSSLFYVMDQESDIIYYYEGGNPVPNPPISTGLPTLYLDSEALPEESRILYLDSNEVRDYTNHFVMEFKFLLIEEEDVFMSDEFAESLYKTAIESKRSKEVVHFQPKLEINLVTSTITTKWFNTYDGLMASAMKWVHLTGNLSQVVKIQIGRGRDYDVFTTLVSTGVKTPVETYTPLATYFNIIDHTTTHLEVEYWIYEYSKIAPIASPTSPVLEISEIALLNSTNTVIAYAYFPTIFFRPEMYTSIAFDIKLA